MGRNDEINAKIRENIIQAKDAIFSCTPSDHMKVLTFDGIIAEGDKTPELVYLLKEANGGTDSSRQAGLDFSGGFDFVAQIRMEAKLYAGKKPLPWDNLCYWTKAYNDARQNTPHYFNHPSVQSCGGLMSEVALVNIKKAPGGSETNHDLLALTVANPICAELVRNEIAIIAPKVVVCCGTYAEAKKLYSEMGISERYLQSGQWCFTYGNICFLEFYHPSLLGAAAKRSMTYAYAKEVFQELAESFEKGTY